MPLMAAGEAGSSFAGSMSSLVLIYLPPCPSVTSSTPERDPGSGSPCPLNSRPPTYAALTSSRTSATPPAINSTERFTLLCLLLNTVILNLGYIYPHPRPFSQGEKG